MKGRVRVLVWWPLLLGLLVSGLQPISLEEPPGTIAFEDLAAFNQTQACGQPLHSDQTDPAQHCPPCLVVPVGIAVVSAPIDLHGYPLGEQPLSVQAALVQLARTLSYSSRAPPALAL